MATTRADSPHPAGPALQILSTLASLAVGAMFFALWFWLLPGRLGFQTYFHTIPRWRWLAAIPSILGFAVALRCIWDFGWTGRGTPAPVAPPTRLVVVGFYRYVRIPMYVGFFTGWIGLWIIFGRANTAALFVAVVAILAVVLFVRLYEEPTLRKLFGSRLHPLLPKRPPLAPPPPPLAPLAPQSYTTLRATLALLYVALAFMLAVFSPPPWRAWERQCSASFYASRLSPQPGPGHWSANLQIGQQLRSSSPTRSFGSERSPRPHCSGGAAQ